MDNLTEEEITQLETLLKKLNQINNPNIPNKTKRFKPKFGEYYWHVNDYIYAEQRICHNYRADQENYINHNCFQTEAEAKFETEKHEVYNELLTYAEEHNECEIDWNNLKQRKWFLWYSCVVHRIDTEYNTSAKTARQVYFTSDEIARAAVKTIGEDRIKKYLFEVSDAE